MIEWLGIGLFFELSGAETRRRCPPQARAVVEREDIKEEHKMLILRENARNMYGEP